MCQDTLGLMGVTTLFVELFCNSITCTSFILVLDKHLGPDNNCIAPAMLLRASVFVEMYEVECEQRSANYWACPTWQVTSKICSNMLLTHAVCINI